MKVLDLQCAQLHVFEGWFGCEEDYLAQHRQGQLSCPICGETQVEKKLSAQVEKKLSAPRLNLKRSQAADVAAPQAESAAPQTEAPSVADLSPAQLQAAYMHVVREMLRQTEDVGERFAQEARAIHAGEADDRPIRGQTSPEQAQELAEEGISVIALPVPEFAKQTLQ